MILRRRQIDSTKDIFIIDITSYQVSKNVCTLFTLHISQHGKMIKSRIFLKMRFEKIYKNDNNKSLLTGVDGLS